MSGTNNSTIIAELVMPARSNPLAHEAASLLVGSLHEAGSPLHVGDDDFLQDMDKYFIPTLVALRGRTAVATGSILLLAHSGDLTALATNLAVASEHRGIGLGSRIMSGLAAKATQLGAKQIVAQSEAGTAGFYKKLGYSHMPDSSFAVPPDVEAYVKFLEPQPSAQR